MNGIPDEQNAALKELERQTNTLRNYLLGIEERKSLYEFSRVRDVDVAVEIGKGIIDAAALAAGIVMTGPAGVFVGLGIDSLAIALCVEHGDDEQAVARTVGVIAGMGAGAVVKYADKLAELGDDVIIVRHKNNLDVVDDFKGFNLDDSEVFFENENEVVEGGLESGTVSNADVRKWYLEQEAKIPDLIDDSLPLEQQARQAFDLKNQYRTQARELMLDRQLAESLYATDPNLTWDQMIQKQIDKGLSGDDIYKAIIESSQRSRTSVNQSLGLE